jgi:hypothetical protein
LPLVRIVEHIKKSPLCILLFNKGCKHNFPVTWPSLHTCRCNVEQLSTSNTMKWNWLNSIFHNFIKLFIQTCYYCHRCLPYLILTLTGTLDSFMWGKYPANLWKVGCSTLVPVCAWIIVQKGIWGLPLLVKLECHSFTCTRLVWHTTYSTNN